MKNLLIHIGYHKTGTTWLQRELFLPESDIFSPITNRADGSSSLALDFVYNEDGYLINSFDNNEKAIQNSLDDILDTIEIQDLKIPVISHERLSGNPQSSGFDAYIVARRLHNFFPEAKILIVIREQCSWILSNYFQYLSIGGNHHLEKYLKIKYDGKRPGFSPGHVEFHHLIKDYQSRYSADNVLVIPYEIFDRDKELFFNQLGKFIGKDLSTMDLDYGKKIHARTNHYLNYRLKFLNPYLNSSSVNNYSALVNPISKKIITKGKNALAYAIPDKLNKSTKEKLLKRIRDWAGDRFKESNKITSELTGINLSELGYRS